MDDNERAEKSKRRIGAEKASLNQWVFALLTIMFGIVIAIKVVLSPMKWSFLTFSFNDFLSLLVSFFAIGLSIAFYFKATQSSNEFYDNTYKFTKDISIMLGRIESGFGEKLKHLDEGYSGILNRFTNGREQIEQTKLDIETEEQKAKEVEDERQKIIDKLLAQADIQSVEKQNILRELKEADKNILKYRQEIERLRAELNQVQSLVPSSTIEWLKRALINKPEFTIALRNGNTVLIDRLFFKYVSKILTVKDAYQLQEQGIIDEKLFLTREGLDLLRSIANEKISIKMK